MAHFIKKSALQTELFLIFYSLGIVYLSSPGRALGVQNNLRILLQFGTCRLANQLGVDVEEAFNMVQKEILAKYNHKNKENYLIKDVIS